MCKVVGKVQPRPDQKAKGIDVDVIDQLAEDTEEDRKRQIFFLVKAIEEAVEISDQKKDKAVEAEGPRVEHIHQKPREEPIKHPRQIPVQKAEGKGKHQEKVGAFREKGDQRKDAGLDQKGKNQRECMDQKTHSPVLQFFGKFSLQSNRLSHLLPNGRPLMPYCGAELSALSPDEVSLPSELLLSGRPPASTTGTFSPSAAELPALLSGFVSDSAAGSAPELSFV